MNMPDIPHMARKMIPYYYATGLDANHDFIVIGPFESKEQARQDAGDTENLVIYKEITRDHDEATRRIKAQRIKTTGSTGKAMQRYRHQQVESEEDDDDEMDAAAPEPKQQGEPRGMFDQRLFTKE